MKIITQPLSCTESTYNLSSIGNLDDILFVDIETTGFHAKSAYLYMIGVLLYEEGSWYIRQFLAENYEDEQTILNEFIKLCKNHKILIHYNGNAFDIPFLKQKCKQYEIASPFDDMSGVDIYKRIAPFKKLLHLENCKQKTLEAFMNIKREDVYNGGELINVYHDYVKNHSMESENLLLLHNKNDMEGMYGLLPILTYMDILMVPFRVTKVQANHFNGLHDVTCHEVQMKIRFLSPFPKLLSLNANGCYFTCDGTEGFLKVPLIINELKYFYSNYQEYYYLPIEDTAIHKSVSSFVEKEYRQQAKASNCYTKKEGNYLPQWDTIFTPVFKQSYEDKQLYFELTESLKRSPSEFTRYAVHVMDMLINI